MSNLEKLLVMVTAEEDKFYEYAHKAIEEKKLLDNMLNVAQASAYQRVRYTIEDMLQEESK